jgi:hypothetical protein
MFFSNAVRTSSLSQEPNFALNNWESLRSAYSHIGSFNEGHEGTYQC